MSHVDTMAYRILWHMAIHPGIMVLVRWKAWAQAELWAAGPHLRVMWAHWAWTRQAQGSSATFHPGPLPNP